MSPPEDPKHLEAIAELLASRGLDASDFISAIEVLGNLKKKESNNKSKAEAKIKSSEKKIYKDKEFVFETRQDCFIYRDARTKCGNYYIRIYDAITRKEFSKSLRTSNRHQALVAAEIMYREKRDKITRGVKMSSINTGQLIETYLNQRLKEKSSIPHTGITPDSLDRLKTKLDYWQKYITILKLEKRPLEKIPPEVGKEFGLWMLNLPKQYYRGRPRSRETVNHTIAAIKKMYKDIAVEDKYIAMGDMPQFRYLKVQRDTAPKRDILEESEYMELCRWMQYTYTRDKNITELERTKRKVFGKYLTIQYNTGCRNKEMLGLRWCDIEPNPHSKDDTARLVNIPASNSKTGKGRQVASNIGDKLNAILKAYKHIGYIPEDTDYIFSNIASTKRGKNIPYQTPAMEKRLKDVLVGSGLQDKFDSEVPKRTIVLYSGRHYYCSMRLKNGVDIYLLALNMGTSVKYIEQTYSHLTTSIMTNEITKGQGWSAKDIENED